MKSERLVWATAIIVLVATAIWFVPRGLRLYAGFQIEKAKQEGIFPTAEAGMRSLIAGTYDAIERVEIDQAGTNSFDGSDAHIWFVQARVYTPRRADGRSTGDRGYDNPGSFFIHISDGWVHVPEGAFPELVGWVTARFEMYGCDKGEGNCR